MGRLNSVPGVLAIGAVLAGGAVWGGLEFAESVETDYAQAAQATPTPTGVTVGKPLTEGERAELGALTRELLTGQGKVQTGQASWVDRDMRVARIPVVFTNTTSTPQRITAQVRVVSGDGASLYTGVLDAGGEVAPGASVLDEIEVQSVHDVGGLGVDLSPVGAES